MYLVLGNVERVNTWYMTNISLDEIMIYTPNTEQAIHEIVFIDTEPLTMITSMFPLLNKMCGCIDVSKLCGAINKYKGSKPLEMVVDQDGVNVSVVGDDFIANVGRLTSPENIEIYTRVFDEYIGRGKPSDSPRESKFPVDITSIDKNEIIKIPIYSDCVESLNSVWRVNIPLKDGFNIVSILEYWKKTKQDVSNLDVCVCKNTGKTIRTLCRYVDGWIKVISIQPAALWFPMNHES